MAWHDLDTGRCDDDGDDDCAGKSGRQPVGGSDQSKTTPKMPEFPVRPQFEFVLSGICVGQGGTRTRTGTEQKVLLAAAVVVSLLIHPLGTGSHVLFSHPSFTIQLHPSVYPSSVNTIMDGWSYPLLSCYFVCF